MVRLTILLLLACKAKWAVWGWLRMPKFEDLKKVLVVGSGGIVIAQAAEFDYSGSQALKALREEGIETVLVNPNIATIQTSKRMADRIYLEPCIPEVVAQIIRTEKPDGVMLGFGGQTGINVGLQLARRGVFDRGPRVLGSSLRAIEITEDRQLFKTAMEKAGVPVPPSGATYSTEEALSTAERIGYPVIVRTAWMLGGGGAGVAYKPSQLKHIVDRALEWSIEHQVLVEKYLEHWKEIEYEVMRDHADNTITVAALENVDPLGIHTGDKMVVAPTQTLTNREYQILRDVSINVVRSVGIIGECNIQLGLNPRSEEYVAIEVNPRMSRSSALASKATGYPLAYIAAKVAIGYTLPELLNKVTGVTTACFEPALDYVVVKIPRWDFPKFPGMVDRHVGPMMKSVGEVMSIARTFEEALQKAVRELEIGKIGLVGNPGDDQPEPIEKIREELLRPTDERWFRIPQAMKAGISIGEINELSGIDPWYLYKVKNIVDMERRLQGLSLSDDVEVVESIRGAKRLGFSDKQIARCLRTDELKVRGFRKRHGILPSFKIVDTMAAEWPSKTNYCYVTYGDQEDDVEFGGSKSKVLVLGAGCIRIGSSVEFDYCTMHTAWSMKGEGVDEVIVVNNNPETVSTDYDMSDKLYFEEITLERILDIIDKEKPMGVVVSVGGQTPNNLALPLARAGIRLLGTSAKSIDRAEDRSKFSVLLDRIGIEQPLWSSLTSLDEAKAFAKRIGYPVLIRPSYVLSGAAMRVAYDESEMSEYVGLAASVSPEHPVVITKFMENSQEVEVDAVSDGSDVLIGAVLEHIELAGTHSGDATMVIPPQTLDSRVMRKIEEYTFKIARALNIRGPFNIQFLVRGDLVYIIELNLRASRSMPYTSKSTGVPLIWLGAKVMLGKTLRELNCLKRPKMMHVAVKAPMFSFMRLRGADPVLGVEMTSTGEVACLDYDFAGALIKALTATNLRIQKTGTPVLLTVRNQDDAEAVEIGRLLDQMKYPIYATEGTAKVLGEAGVGVAKVFKKIHEESDGGENILDYLSARKIGLVINTPSTTSHRSVDDGFAIRRTAVEFFVPVITRIETAMALIKAMSENGSGFSIRARPLDEFLANAPLGQYV